MEPRFPWQRSESWWAHLWEDKRYQRLHARKDALGARWNRADAERDPSAPKLEAAFRRACRRIQKFEEKAPA